MTERLPRPKSNAHILIVEDEPRFRELLVRAISGWGFEVMAARSGEEALRQNNGTTAIADVVVLDLNLPGIGGLDFLAKLRERSPHVQAIVLTGYASVDAARQAVHLDVVEFLTKPCHLGELERALDRALRRLSAAPARDAAMLSKEPPPPVGASLEEVERRHILATLELHSGNRTATAAALGISRRTLYYKLEEYQKQGFRID